VSGQGISYWQSKLKAHTKHTKEESRAPAYPCPLVE